MKNNLYYHWLLDSIYDIGAFRYFSCISNPIEQGVFLVSKYKRNKTVISILRTSKRCYKVCYNYMNYKLTFLYQEFKTFNNVSSLCDWLVNDIFPDFNSNAAQKGVNITNKGV